MLHVDYCNKIKNSYRSIGCTYVSIVRIYTVHTVLHTVMALGVHLHRVVVCSVGITVSNLSVRGH